MLLNWTLTPQGLSADNNYVLNLQFENNENENYWIYKVNVLFPDYSKAFYEEIKQEFKAPIFGLINRRKIVPIKIKVEENVVLPRRFFVILQVSKLLDDQWTPIFNLKLPLQVLQIKPLPLYHAFISRSIREDESKIPDFLNNIISNWAFTTSTIGITPLIKNFSDDQLLKAVISEIKKSDIVFAIATKRDQLLENLQWRTFEWLQSEAALAYALKKIIIVFVEDGVELSGLVSKLKVIKFHPNKFELIKKFFDQYMPKVRALIGKKKNTDFFFGLLGAGAIVGGIYIIGKLGYEMGKADSKSD